MKKIHVGTVSYANDAMSEVTPVRDPDTFAKLEAAAQQPGRLGRLRGLRAFIEYLCGEDANHLSVLDV